MRKLSNTYKQGFTLIELLVVVAIIGLLSSVTLASVQTGRTKAQNTTKVQLLKQYVNALALYRTSSITSTYPAVTAGTFYCLGSDNTGDTCHGSATIYSSENTTLNTALSPYISGPPASKDSVPAGTGTDMRGILYRCNDAACTNYSLKWAMQGNNSGGNNSQCIVGSFQLNNPTYSYFICQYDSDSSPS
ncbi:MAG: prepilin-type N-terminal cleavage/methylation domain-containing protein [bacterium]|nr:prepilin-type N-terminal cleavage/methylation domain-containing protein [bacterium]